MPPRLYADEYADACQLLLDPSIAMLRREGERIGVIEIPAGWVSVVNFMHHELTTELGVYQVISAGDKAGALRYMVDRRTPSSDSIISAARTFSRNICAVCGYRLASGEQVRCRLHPRLTTPVVIARPPGWSPPAA